MATWVRNLCTVCGMKPDESGSEAEGSPQMPVREELPRKTQLTQPTSIASPSHIGVMSKPNISATLPANRSSPSTKARSGVTMSKSPVSATSKPQMNDRDSEYLPLSDCTSGSSIKRTERQISVDSVPEDFAPPPPGPKGVGRGADSDRDSDVFGTVGSINNTMIYDIPPSSGKYDDDVDDLYKVPPPHPSKGNSNLEPYDILPPTHHSPSTPRSSSSESQKVDSAYSSQGFYDTPPTRGDLTQDDTYDIPPSHNDRLSLNNTPPMRPPKPIHLSTSVPGQEPYMNLPTNSRVLASQSVDINSVVLPQAVGMTKLDPAELYDFPRSTLVDNHNNNNVLSDKVMGMVPPPNSCGQREHKYINAYHGMVDDTQDVYLSMDPVSGKPRKSSSTDNEVEYTDMSGRSDFDDSFEGKTVYDHPPPSRPTAPPPRPIKSTLTETQDTYSIFSNTRTRSFKKKPSEGSPSIKRRSPTSNSVQSSAAVKVPLPQRSIDRHPDFSTSDEDDDDMGSPDVWETTVPAPTNKDTELKYVDLDHDEEKEPVRSPHPISSSLTPTEYHEIDFVKTTVLQNLKEQRNKKSSDTT